MIFSDIHNYYERLVLDYIKRKLLDNQTDEGFLADIACVALNHLPPRYIRFDVDMAYYLSPAERKEIDEKIEQAVQHALSLVKNNPHKKT